MKVGAAQRCALGAGEDQGVKLVGDEVPQVRADVAADRVRDGDRAESGVRLGRAEDEAAVLSLDKSRADRDGPTARVEVAAAQRGEFGAGIFGVVRRGENFLYVAGAIPPAIDPGKPSTPPPGPPASVRAVKARLTWRAGRRPAPQEGGSTADGMAFPLGCGEKSVSHINV